MSVVSYRRLLLVPGSSGVWAGKQPSAFRLTLEAQLQALLQTQVLSLDADYSDASCQLRQQSVERVISTARHSNQIWVGHSEGGARLLHALRNLKAGSRLQALILISPAYAIRSVGAVDVSAAIQTLQAHSVRVLLLDTELGFGGNDIKYTWSTTRGELTHAVRLDQRWTHAVIKNSHHSLRKGKAHKATDTIVRWLQTWHT